MASTDEYTLRVVNVNLNTKAFFSVVYNVHCFMITIQKRAFEV